MLRRLPAQKRDAHELARPRDAAHDVGDPLRVDAPAGDVVRHEERARADHRDVVDDHADEVLADRVVHVEGTGYGDLRSDAVGRRRQKGPLELPQGGGVDHSGEAPHPADDVGAERAPDGGFHELDGAVPGLRVDPGRRIGGYPFFHRSSNRPFTGFPTARPRPRAR